MSYEKFTMYLSTIPDYSSDEDEGDATKNRHKEATGSFNLFDFDER